MRLLTDLPSDVIQLIASYLLPYDILVLSTVCRTFKPLRNERATWMQIAERVSESRPLPFTATQALDLPLEFVIGACLRAQRIAKGWAEPNVYHRGQPIKITFPDHRIITYFTFLPGSRHVMVYDALNVLSCWTTEGRLLEAWRVKHGAKMARWKPCDQSESSYDFQGGRVQAVEIMLELPFPDHSSFRHSRPTRCDLLLLSYSENCARLHPVGKFKIPNVYEPFSAMTQDELRGSLVRLNTEPGRVGIFLTDKNTETSVCIDTGLALDIASVPQALLSSSHLVLYWELQSSAHTFAYEIDALRELIAREGRPHDDPSLWVPVSLHPSDVCGIPFRNVSAPMSRSVSASCLTCRGCRRRVDQQFFPSTDLSRNRHAYPIIIPKWHTLRENLGRHRTRSILTFSRLPLNTVQVQAQALALYVNAPNFDTLHIHLVSEDGVADPHGADNTGAVPAEGGLDPLGELRTVGHSRRLAPRTTITHHYFDYAGSSSGNTPREIVRTVLADAPLRRPQSLRVNQNHAQALMVADGGLNFNGAGTHHMGGHDGEADVQILEESGNGADLDDMELIDFDGQLLDVHNGEDEGEEEEENDPQNDFNDVYNDYGDLLPDDEELQNEELTAPFTHRPNRGDNREHAAMPQVGVHHEGSIWNLTPEAVQALTDILQDPFGGSPVMGYGGRCAMWVEEHPKEYRSGGMNREPVLRVATFPTYEPPGEDKATTYIHPELEMSSGRVGTFHLPRDIPLESSYTFDLDDVRGFVGIATLFGELWIVDYS